VITIQAARIEIRDSYFHDTMVGGGDSRDSKRAAIVNPLAAGAVLPDSMYLKAKPAWRGEGAWAAFDATRPATSTADLKTESLALNACARWHALFPSKVPTTTPN